MGDMVVCDGWSSKVKEIRPCPLLGRWVLNTPNSTCEEPGSPYRKWATEGCDPMDARAVANLARLALKEGKRKGGSINARR